MHDHTKLEWDHAMTRKQPKKQDDEPGSPDSASAAGSVDDGPKTFENDAMIVFCDFLIPGADPKIYEEVTDIAELQPLIEEYLSEYNRCERESEPPK